jgi:hypothetical protein
MSKGLEFSDTPMQNVSISCDAVTCPRDWNSQIHQCKNLKPCTECAIIKRLGKTNHIHARQMILEFLAGGGIK